MSKGGCVEHLNKEDPAFHLLDQLVEEQFNDHKNKAPIKSFLTEILNHVLYESIRLCPWQQWLNTLDVWFDTNDTNHSAKAYDVLSMISGDFLFYQLFNDSKYIVRACSRLKETIDE